MIEVYDPGNRELVEAVPSAGREDVEHVLATAGNAGGVGTEDDDLLYGYDAEYGMGGDACIHNIARYVPVVPRKVSMSLRYLPFGA